VATSTRGLAVDSNILISAALGRRVRNIFRRFHGEITFWAPEACRRDARRRIPEICRKHGLDEKAALEFLDDVQKVVSFVGPVTYANQEQNARERIQSRDPDDWPVLATALALDLPLWTEDRDFFGCGVATWITNNIEIYLRGN